LVRPKDKVNDEEKTELIYGSLARTATYSSYIGETGRKLGPRMKEHRKEVDSFTAGTQTRASRAMESNVTHKSAITDHAVEQTMSSTGTVQKWSPAAHRQTRWIKEAFWTWKTRHA